jgi:hypothetical protein
MAMDDADVSAAVTDAIEHHVKLGGAPPMAPGAGLVEEEGGGDDAAAAAPPPRRFHVSTVDTDDIDLEKEPEWRALHEMKPGMKCDDCSALLVKGRDFNDVCWTCWKVCSTTKWLEAGLSEEEIATITAETQAKVIAGAGNPNSQKFLVFDGIVDVIQKQADAEKKVCDICMVRPSIESAGKFIRVEDFSAGSCTSRKARACEVCMVRLVQPTATSMEIKHRICRHQHGTEYGVRNR